MDTHAVIDPYEGQCCTDPQEIWDRSEVVCRNCGTVLDQRWEEEISYPRVAAYSAPMITTNRDINEIVNGNGWSYEKKIQYLEYARKGGKKTLLRAMNKLPKTLKIHEHFETNELNRKRFKQIQLLHKMQRDRTRKEVLQRLKFPRGMYYYWRNKKAPRKPGRKPSKTKVLEKYRMQIKAYRENGMSVDQILQLIEAEYQIGCSRATMARFIRKLEE